ncbi:hypothetical protein EVAR_558_1 [Eumeta japonica]|uniref:Uncharacterized protein n=1 Tax=Eumeta variegata TaxID=151549 RepID=A0A4C1SBS9_EUMVA|nr:hypothetical protein EVAR_558_1 [Eumeta japonica]
MCCNLPAMRRDTALSQPARPRRRPLITRAATSGVPPAPPPRPRPLPRPPQSERRAFDNRKLADGFGPTRDAVRCRASGHPPQRRLALLRCVRLSFGADTTFDVAPECACDELDTFLMN